MCIEQEWDIDDIVNQAFDEFEPDSFNEMEDLGAFIKTTRKDKGLTQSQLARETGLSPSTISKLECGKLLYPPSAEAIAALADSLKVSEYLLSLRAGRIPKEMRGLLCSFLIILETPEKADKVIDICCAAELVGAKIVIESTQ